MSTLPVLTFGALLRRARLAAGLSQEELAERAHLSRETISTLERQTRRAPRKDTIDLLADALGLAPAERARLQQVARGQMAAAAASIPHLPLARELLPLAGRRQEVARLERHLAGEASPLLLLAGEPGIGKSRLLVEAAQHARGQGWTVLEGGCHRRSGQEPFAPLLGALESAIRHAAPAALRAQLDGCAWLVRLLPELAETTLVPAPSWSVPPEQERRLMFAAVARYLANVAGPAGTLLVLDDVQWAGADALDLLASLLRTPGERPLRIVSAYRSTEVRPPDPLGTLLADLGATGLAGEMLLGPLAPEDASTLLMGVLEADQGTPRALREQLVARTGGVPFFLVSCARAIQMGVPGDDLPWDVTQHLRQRIAALPQAAQELLGVAAIIGREAPAAFLLRLAHQPEQDMLTALEVLNQARLLIEAGEETVQFAHDLIREAVLSDLSATRRRALHRRVAEMLEQEPGEPAIERLAYHFAQAGLGEKAVIYLEKAGDHAQALHANSEAEGYYRELVAHLEKLGRHAESVLAREKLARMLSAQAHYDEALAVLEQAVETYRASGDIEGEGRGVAQVGETLRLQGTLPGGIARLQPLLEDLRARGLSTQGLTSLSLALSRLLLSTGQRHEALAVAQRAVDLAATVGNELLLAQAQLLCGMVLGRLGRTGESRQMAQQALPSIETSGDLRLVLSALYCLSLVHLLRAEINQKAVFNARALTVVRQLGDPAELAGIWFNLGMDAFELIGAWEEARTYLDQALALLRQVGFSDRWAEPLLGLGLLSLAEGHAEAASEYLEEVIAGAKHRGNREGLRYAQYGLAERDLLESRPTQALARLEPLRAGLEEDEVFLPTKFVPFLAWALLEVGGEEEAEALLAPSIARARVQENRLVLLDALRIEGWLRMRQQRWAEAEAALEEVLRLSQRLTFPYYEAKALYVYGLLHRAKGEPSQAHERLEAALAILNRLGERLYAEQVERALATLAG